MALRVSGSVILRPEHWPQQGALLRVCLCRFVACATHSREGVRQCLGSLLFTSNPGCDAFEKHHVQQKHALPLVANQMAAAKQQQIAKTVERVPKRTAKTGPKQIAKKCQNEQKNCKNGRRRARSAKDDRGASCCWFSGSSLVAI